MNKPVITFVAALSCEAKALLDLHRAKKICDKPFAFFLAESEKAVFEVLVTGIGALSMATAIGWLGAYRPVDSRVWLNVGTAGHGSKAIGEAFRVHTSQDILHERKHLPPLVASSIFDSDELMSVNAPTSDYPAVGGMDMEAYAFFNAANRFSSSEVVQAIKVVSDNPEHGLENLNAQTISELLQPHTSGINDFALRLLELVEVTTVKRSPENQPTLQSNDITVPDVRMTHSQRLQLHSLLKKLDALDAVNGELTKKINNAVSFKELSILLRSRLDSCVPVIADAS